jgi:hypothetical protein
MGKLLREEEDRDAYVMGMMTRIEKKSNKKSMHHYHTTI